MCDSPFACLPLPQMGNVAGEQPLYIAALRGEVEAVKVLLRAFKQRGLSWIDAKL